MQNILPFLFIFFFGAIVGSFLNCVIYRLETGGNFLKGRSFCPRCKHVLSWQDLIPIFSFIGLGGRCRYCQQKISWQYPLVEISTAVIFLLIFNYQFLIFKQFLILNFLNLFFYWIIASFLIIIFVYDLKHYIIPDKIIYPAIATTFLYQLFRILDFEFILKFGFWNLDFKILINSLISAFLASAFFFLIVFVSQGKWMGVGDIKLAFLMGLILSWPDISVALVSAFYIGAIFGLGLMTFGKKKMKSEVPFAPFLVTGTFLALFWGSELIDWYQTTFLLK